MKYKTKIEGAEAVPPLSIVELDDTRPVAITSHQLINIYGHVIVESAPSGKRYETGLGQVFPVEPADYHYLLSLRRDPGPGCCGGVPADQRLRYYFAIQ